MIKTPQKERTMTRVTNEEIIAAYQRTRSVWKAGKELGVSGQFVHQKLRSLDVKITGNRKWTAEELAEMKSLLENGCSPHQVAERLGRTFAAVACKLNDIGIRSYRVARERKIKRGAGYDKAAMAKHMKHLEAHPHIKITPYSRSVGLEIELVAQSLQRHFPDRWAAYIEAHHGDITRKECPYCKALFIPANGKQTFCTRICANHSRVDASYFGGRRRDALGFDQGTCQLCLKENVKNLQVHHMCGKVNDPDNTRLVALCPGCHAIVGKLAYSKRIVNSPEAWERLIQLAWMEANGAQAMAAEPGSGIYTCVDIEFQPPDPD